MRGHSTRSPASGPKAASPPSTRGLRTKIAQSILAAALLMAIKEEVAAGVKSVLAPMPRRRQRVAALVAAR